MEFTEIKFYLFELSNHDFKILNTEYPLKKDTSPYYLKTMSSMVCKLDM